MQVSNWVVMVCSGVGGLTNAFGGGGEQWGELRLVALANFCGVNTPTVANFKVPIQDHSL